MRFFSLGKFIGDSNLKTPTKNGYTNDHDVTTSNILRCLFNKMAMDPITKWNQASDLTSH
jgi:hypothetical protein